MACTTRSWRARRRRDGASRQTSPASRCFSPHPPPTSSPAPPFPSMADFRSWDETRRLPETLDLRDASVAIGQFHRHELRHGRDLEIRLCVMGNLEGIPGIAGRHFQDLVRYRRVYSDADLADRAAIRHQVRVIDQEPVELPKCQPTGRGHIEDFSLIVNQHGLGIEFYWKRPLQFARYIDIADLDGRRRRVAGEF